MKSTYLAPSEELAEGALGTFTLKKMRYEVSNDFKVLTNAVARGNSIFVLSRDFSKDGVYLQCHRIRKLYDSQSNQKSAVVPNIGFGYKASFYGLAKYCEEMDNA